MDLFLTDSQFKDRFRVIHNNPNGNCLFHCFIQLLSKETNIKTTHVLSMRKALCSFYSQFDKTQQYDENTTRYKIWLGLLYDNIDENEECHDVQIQFNCVWASMTDVLALSIMFQVNVILLQLDANNVYSIHPIFNDATYKHIYLLYKNNNHFEALDPLVPAPIPVLCKEHKVEKKKEDPFIVVQKKHKHIKV